MFYSRQTCSIVWILQTCISCILCQLQMSAEKIDLAVETRAQRNRNWQQVQVDVVLGCRELKKKLEKGMYCLRFSFKW